MDLSETEFGILVFRELRRRDLVIIMMNWAGLLPLTVLVSVHVRQAHLPSRQNHKSFFCDGHHCVLCELMQLFDCDFRSQFRPVRVTEGVNHE